MQQFYVKIAKHFKELIKLSKSIAKREVCCAQILNTLDQVMSDKPPAFTRLVFEKSLFPGENNIAGDPENPKQGKDFLFFGSLNFEISNVAFVENELRSLYPMLDKLWGTDDWLMDFVGKYAIMMREVFKRALLN